MIYFYSIENIKYDFNFHYQKSKQMRVKGIKAETRE